MKGALSFKPAVCGILAILSILIPRLARAQVGNRNFINPLVTYDPSPSNNFFFQPYYFNTTGRGQSYTLAAGIEKQLSENTSILAASFWNYLSCVGKDQLCVSEGRNKAPRHSAHRHHHRRKHHEGKAEPVGQIGSSAGMGDLELLFNYAFYTSTRHEFRLGIDLDSFWPTGHLNSGGSSHPLLGPVLMAAKGFGDLPNRGFFRFLRPLAWEIDAEFLDKITGTYEYDMLTNTIIEYSIPYLLRYVGDYNVPGVLRNIVPFSEFTYEQIAASHYGGSPPDFRWLPGLAYLTDKYQVSIGAQVPINHRATIYDRFAFLALINISFDQIWPQTGWTPF